jgi:hypothetical protein
MPGSYDAAVLLGSRGRAEPGLPEEALSEFADGFGNESRDVGAANDAISSTEKWS